MYECLIGKTKVKDIILETKSPMDVGLCTYEELERVLKELEKKQKIQLEAEKLFK